MALKEFDIAITPNISRFFEEFETKLIGISQSGNIDTNSRVFLLVLLGLRAISKDLYINKQGPRALESAFNEVREFMIKNDFFKGEKVSGFSGAKSESPFNATLRRINSLAIITDNIFVTSSNKAFLNMKNIPKELKLLFNIIFKSKKLGLIERQKIQSFLREFYNKYAPQLFSDLGLNNNDQKQFGLELDEFLIFNYTN